MAGREEFVTEYTLRDRYSGGLRGMIGLTALFERQALKARAAAAGVGAAGARGGALGALMGGGAGVGGGFLAGAGAMGLASFTANMAGGGGMISRVITAPLSVVSGAVRTIGQTVSQLASTLPIVGGAIAGVVGSLTSLVSISLEVANAILSVLARALETLIHVASQAAGVLLRVGGVIGGALLGLGVMAVRTAAEFETMEKSLGALLGSLARGRQAMLFIEQYGMKSAFDQGPLLEAARSIVAASLSLSRFLPILERLALLRGPQPENLIDVAAIFRRIIGGQIAEGFGPEGLGRLGINKMMLEQFGARFDKQGSFIGSVQDALLVLERLASSPKFAMLTELMESSAAVKFSNAMDAVNKALRTLGDSILPVITPYLDEIVSVLNEFTASGRLKQLAAGLLATFGMDEKKEGFRSFLYHVLAVFTRLPELLTAVKDVAIKGVQVFLGLVEKIVNMMVLVVNNLISAWNQIMVVKIKYLPELNFGELWKTMRRALGSNENPLKAWWDTVRSDADKMMGESGKGAIQTVADPTANATLDHLGRIAGATDDTAKATKAILEVEMKRYALGGGRTGRFGITEVELANIRREQRGIDIRIKGEARDMLERVIYGIVEDALLQVARQTGSR